MITPDEILRKKVQSMRHWQKKFFASKPGSAERQEALEMSRRYEASVDQALSQEPGLFEEEAA